ncbi:MAG: hypothetical protein ACTHLN_04770 [Tepidisphaeraceae bacterium]
MVTIDTLEGLIDGVLTYHYDVGNDVLYLRLRSAMGQDTYGEETDEGDILLRHPTTDEPVGLTILNWWKRFGEGALPDSIEAI